MKNETRSRHAREAAAAVAKLKELLRKLEALAAELEKMGSAEDDNEPKSNQ